MGKIIKNKNISIESCKIPNILACLPEGTRLFPACSIYPGKEGWIILPPEKDLESEESFQKWKDQTYDNAIDLGSK